MSRSDEITDQQGNRDTLAAYFKLHPLEDIEADTLKTLIGDNYQQRVSDCRRDLGLYIENLPRWAAQDGSGRKKRLAGGYRFYPDGKPLGNDSGVPGRAQEWATEHGRPFQPEFRLTPPNTEVR